VKGTVSSGAENHHVEWGFVLFGNGTRRWADRGGRRRPRRRTVSQPDVGQRGGTHQGAIPPRPAGTTFAPVMNGRRDRLSSSVWAAPKNGCPKPRATDPPDHRQLHVADGVKEASARPISKPVRSTIAMGARWGGRPVSCSRDGPLQ
jgi:hypothetical protein